MKYWSTLGLLLTITLSISIRVLAGGYSLAGNYRMAFQTLQKQEQVAGPSMNYVHWYNLGNGYLNTYYSGQNGAPVGSGGTEILRRAEHAYQQCLRMNSRFGDAWNNLGTTEQALGVAQNALNDYKQAAALGDPLAHGNYTNLQNAIAAARAQAAQAGRCGPITEYRQGCPFVPGWVVAHETAVFNWNHSYHEPGDIQGRPY